MNLAFCYESVLPTKGGCETYIADLSNRLVADGHQVHLYACRWDPASLPASMICHLLPPIGGPRFLRPWRFGRACLRAIADERHDVTVGFDKTWGLDVLYPQGGLHRASADHNVHKFASPLMRGAARALKLLDPAHWSYSMLERRQYLGEKKPLIIVNSNMVRDHFQHYYSVSSQDLHVVRSMIDPGRFPEHDRLKRRQEMRQAWGLDPSHTVGLFAAMNYRLKGLDPLLHGVARMRATAEFRERAEAFRLVIVGNPKFGGYERLAAPARDRGAEVRLHRSLSRDEERVLRVGLPRPSDLLRPVLAGGARGAGVRVAGDHDAGERGERASQSAAGGVRAGRSARSGADGVVSGDAARSGAPPCVHDRGAEDGDDVDVRGALSAVARGVPGRGVAEEGGVTADR